MYLFRGRKLRYNLPGAIFDHEPTQNHDRSDEPKERFPQDNGPKDEIQLYPLPDPPHATDHSEDVSLQPDLEEQRQPPVPPPARKRGVRKYFSSVAWWGEEYWYAMICLVTAACLGYLLAHYDNHLVPDLGWGLQIDTAIIALVSIVRTSLKGFVETALSQSAWIWVSESSQRRRKHTARLADFKVFHEASQGL
jgi:hypothetical protein